MEETLCPATGAGCCPAISRPSLSDLRARFAREATTGTCDTGRYDCRYFVWGQGPPLLMIPGMADDSQSFLQLASELASSFRCIAYDLPAGRHDRARLRRYTHEGLVADAFALLDHLHIS